MTFWTALAAAAAALSALLSVRLTSLTRRTVRDASLPNVIVYTHTSGDRPTIIQLIIANVGRGVASDIVFQTTRVLPQRAFGLEKPDADAVEAMHDGPLVSGIPYLAPGERRVIEWGQFGGLMAAIGEDYVGVTAIYSHGAEKIQTHSRIEVKSFLGTPANNSNARDAVRELEKIAEASKRMSRAVESISAHLRVSDKDVRTAGALTRVAADNAADVL